MPEQVPSQQVLDQVRVSALKTIASLRTLPLNLSLLHSMVVESIRSGTITVADLLTLGRDMDEVYGCVGPKAIAQDVLRNKIEWTSLAGLENEAIISVLHAYQDLETEAEI